VAIGRSAKVAERRMQEDDQLTSDEETELFAQETIFRTGAVQELKQMVEIFLRCGQGGDQARYLAGIRA